jgi:hypothetical protein
LAHVFYRTAALVYAEHSGRNLETASVKEIIPKEEKKKEAEPEQVIEVVAEGDTSSSGSDS